MSEVVHQNAGALRCAATGDEECMALGACGESGACVRTPKPDKWAPMTEDQRRQWREQGVFPVERWGTGPGSTPLMCPLPDRALLRKLAEAIPPHIQSCGWYATGQRYESRTVHAVYGDNFRGMGRQAIASVISSPSYSGPLADYIAAACPRTMLRLLDRIEELEAALAQTGSAA